MRWFAAPHARSRRFFLLFVAGELLLAMAIPFIAIEGYHTLLDSRAGRFVEEPTRHDPGWRALVDSTSVVGVAEVHDGSVTGVTLLIHHREVRAGGTAMLAPGSLLVDGRALHERSPAEAVDALASAMRLGVGRTEVLDEAGWAEVLGSTAYVVDNPDPVLGDDGRPLFSVGPVTVDASNVSAFLGRPAPGAPLVSVRPRRELFWNAIVAAPPETDAPVANDIRAAGGVGQQVLFLPTSQLEPQAIVDPVATESLIRDVVAYPTGFVPGDRLQVRILDRTGVADLEGIAAAVAAQGMEVIEIGNLAVFDGGETQVIVPLGLAGDDGVVPLEVADLSMSVGAASVETDTEPTEDLVVTIVIGRDFDLANLL